MYSAVSIIPEAWRQSICETRPKLCMCTFLHCLHGDQGPLDQPVEISLHVFHQRIPVVLTMLLGICYYVHVCVSQKKVVSWPQVAIQSQCMAVVHNLLLATEIR